MTPYILSLLLASLGAALVELLAPRGEGGRIATHVRALAGLFLLVALLAPLREGLDLLAALSDKDAILDRIDGYLPAEGPADHESTLHATLTSLCAAEAEAWVAETLTARFSVPADHATVSLDCTVEDDRLVATELRIALGGTSALSDPHPIEAYFSDALGCPCYVTVVPPALTPS